MWIACERVEPEPPARQRAQLNVNDLVDAWQLELDVILPEDDGMQLIEDVFDVPVLRGEARGS